MPADPNRVRDVFLSAVELSPDQRPGYLSEACRGDGDLRAEVDQLLVANADPDSILDPHHPAATPPSHSSPAIPDRRFPSGTPATDGPESDAPSPTEQARRDHGPAQSDPDAITAGHRSPSRPA